MYTFNIKKFRSRDKTLIENNDFLSKAYGEVDGNKFANGFVQDVVHLIDQEPFKNKKNTHGGLLEVHAFNGTNRTLDFIINGGITGLKQYLIEEDGEKKELSEKTTVGLKFFCRIWLPTGSSTGYVFLQKYGSLSIKPLLDEIIKSVYSKYEFSVVDNRIKATATEKRQKEFLKSAVLRDITVLSKNSHFETGAPNSKSASIRLKGISINRESKKIDTEDVNKMLKGHGFSIGDKNYEMRGTFENKSNDVPEEKTVILDTSEETINVVPNIVVPSDCVDKDNSPIFEKMRVLADNERAQVMIESKMS